MRLMATARRLLRLDLDFRLGFRLDLSLERGLWLGLDFRLDLSLGCGLWLGLDFRLDLSLGCGLWLWG